MLQRAGEHVVVLERGDGRRGLDDALRPAASAHRSLALVPARLPHAWSFGKWPSRDRVLEYLQRYGRGPRSRCGPASRPSGSIARCDGWTIQDQRGRLEADRVVVATGYSNVPVSPTGRATSGGRSCTPPTTATRPPTRAARARGGRGQLGRRDRGRPRGRRRGGGAARVRTPPSIVRRDTLGFPSQVLGIATAHLPRSGGGSDRPMRRISIPGPRALRPHRRRSHRTRSFCAGA